MTARQPLRIDVDCYAGHRGEQTPRTLIVGNRRVAIAEVLDAWADSGHDDSMLGGSALEDHIIVGVLQSY